MPRSKNQPASRASKKTPTPPSKTSHLFGGRPSKDRGSQITSERIADDLKAFHKAGGRIEKLGITRSLTRIDAAPDAPTGEAAAKPAADTTKPRR
jgi:hypothetical protein